MAQREDFLTDSGDDTNAGTGFGSDRNSDQIRSDIDRTRADMDETFSALESKLTPGQILEEAWGLFKGGSSAGATKLLRVVREHPLPAAVIGLGVGWLLVERSRSLDKSFDGYSEFDFEEDWDSEPSRLAAARDKVKDVASSAKDAVSSAADTVGEKASHLKDEALDLGHKAKDQALDLGHKAQNKAGQLKRKAKTQVRRARTGFWQTMEENPLLVGAATLALGVVAGLAIPSTEVEDEWLGEKRDQFLDQAKELGQEALDKGKQVAETVVDTVKHEAENQGLTPQTLVDKVKTVAQEATNTAKEEVKKQAPALANVAGEGGQPGGQQAPASQPELANKR